MDLDPELQRKAARVKLLLMDCDGVLTDGRVTIFSDGHEQKSFHTRDGQGLVLLHKAGLASGIISGRRSEVVDLRARELGITYVRQGTRNKLAAFEEIVAAAGVSDFETAYVGDDLADFGLVRLSGFGVAVSDAAAEVKRAADYVTILPGGAGCVREVCEIILKSQGRWAGLVEEFLK
jgi:3-deoxy-D-manno-octulosonate 8-phosphate phosphatase (KDO 8-P phosphatase)